MGATPFLRDLTYAEARRDLRSLRLFIAAGAPIPRALVRDARERLGCVDLGGLGHDRERPRHLQRAPTTPRRRSSAATARPGAGHGAPRGGRRRRAGAAGRRGRPAGPRRGPVRRLLQAAAVHRGRPHRRRLVQTGDRATLDPDGYLAITGRTKDVIIRGGENIPVVEVENLLYTHPKIAGVAIVAMPDPRLGERACAVVIPGEGQTLTLTEIIRVPGAAPAGAPEVSRSASSWSPSSP